MESKKTKGQLFLLPNLLDKEASHEVFLPVSVDEAVKKLDGLIAETEKEGRAYLKRFNAPFREMPIVPFNKHHQEVEELLIPMRQGETWGLISDAGLPVLADPGYKLVKRARDYGIVVHAFVGPSSLVLALMLSGLPAQNFAFHGYLPKQNPAKRLKELEKRSSEERCTHLFIEAPFRNDNTLEMVLKTLSDDTYFCVAWNLTCPDQGVEMRKVGEWKKRNLPSLHKKPAIFLFTQSH